MYVLQIRKISTHEQQKTYSSRGAEGASSSEASNPKHVTGWIDSEVSVEEFLSQVKLAEIYQNTNIVSSTLSSQERIEENGKQDQETPVEPAYKAECQDKDSDTEHFIMTGLHACGDLIPTMMRVFAKCKSARSLVSVACCYHKLTPDYDRNR